MLPNDPVVLLSFVNMKLRDSYSSLEDLCEDIDVEPETVIKKLAEGGFKYNPESNQFK